MIVSCAFFKLVAFLLPFSWFVKARRFPAKYTWTPDDRLVCSVIAETHAPTFIISRHGTPAFPRAPAASPLPPNACRPARWPHSFCRNPCFHIIPSWHSRRKNLPPDRLAALSRDTCQIGAGLSRPPALLARYRTPFGKPQAVPHSPVIHPASNQTLLFVHTRTKDADSCNPLRNASGICFLSGNAPSSRRLATYCNPRRERHTTPSWPLTEPRSDLPSASAA